MKLKERYKLNKEAKVGDELICPSCGSTFIKSNYQQAFCKVKTGTKCKDKFWNTVTPTKKIIRHESVLQMQDLWQIENMINCLFIVSMMIFTLLKG